MDTLIIHIVNVAITAFLGAMCLAFGVAILEMSNAGIAKFSKKTQYYIL